jgi:hypothetical protein
VTGTDAIVERILTRYATITVVGASSAPYQGRAPGARAHAAPRLANHPG